jgi:hypothetical protein
VSNNTKEAMLATLNSPPIKAYMHLARRATQLINNLRLHGVVQPHHKLRNACATTPERLLSFRIRELYHPAKSSICSIAAKIGFMVVELSRVEIG